MASSASARAAASAASVSISRPARRATDVEAVTEQIVEPQGVAVARQRVARHVLRRAGLGRLVGGGLQKEREAQLQGQPRVVVGGEGHPVRAARR